LAAIAKHYATNSSFDVANRSVQIFGSEGYKKTSRVARHFLDSRATTIYEGANEVIELKIASEILGSNFKAY
jgi:alkylation response protein AidB-like acyl-CoA dehydrogenase